MAVETKLVQKHKALLRHLEERFRSICAKYGDRMTCGKGCACCCYGLFDISVTDALRVAEGFRALPNEIRASVARRAAAIQGELDRRVPDFKPPYHLNLLSEDQTDQLVERIGKVRCPFLDDQDSCLIYKNRPLACILEGIPMVDVHDGLFGDWCELNFREGVSPEMAADLTLDYYEIREIEQDPTIFIPSVICLEKR